VGVHPVGSYDSRPVVRAALEDRMLLNELVGYQQYTGRVRYRLLPGLW